MYEESTTCQSMRQGLRLDLGDPKKALHSKTDSLMDVLTNRDLGMLELTSPELERLILDPTNERFLGGSFAAFRQQHQQERGQQGRGYNIPCRGEQQQQRDSQRPTDSVQPYLPRSALEAAVSSSEEDSDTESRQVTYTTLVPPKPETGFNRESYFNVDSKPASLATSMISAAPSFVTAGTRYSSSAVGTSLLPTAVHPGESYLPFGALQAIPSRPRLKEEPMQLVPCLEGAPGFSNFSPTSPINMDDQDRARQERKRERNRLAARKCRTKKLEQIVHLEGRVAELKEQNRALGDTATALRAMMNRLQAQISQHITCGCPMMTTTTVATTTTLDPSSFAAQ